MGMISQIYESSKKVPTRTLEFVHLMIDEELGELARAINRPERCDEPAFNEACDLMICIADMMWLLDERRASTHSDNYFNLILRDTFDKPFIKDVYLSYQELRDRVYSISFEQAEIHVYNDCLYAMHDCFSMFRTLKPEFNYQQLRDLITLTIGLKCQKWIGLIKMG